MGALEILEHVVLKWTRVSDARAGLFIKEFREDVKPDYINK